MSARPSFVLDFFASCVTLAVLFEERKALNRKGRKARKENRFADFEF
jgi:hypothetical protein